MTCVPTSLSLGGRALSSSTVDVSVPLAFREVIIGLIEHARAACLPITAFQKPARRSHPAAVERFHML